MGKPRVLIIGGTGQLGTELRRQADEVWDVVALSRAEFDMGDAAAMEGRIGHVAPDVVINASAFHVVDLCESRFQDALLINAVAISALAKACEGIGARFVTVSTDYVFDGRSRIPYRETDRADPVQCYGISKLAGELAAFAAHPEGAYVVRSCGLYGSAASRQKGGNFVVNRLADASRSDRIEVGSDLTCTPTSASDLAEALIRLLTCEAPAGLYHLTNSGACDWATFTAEILRQSGSTAAVVPIDRGGRYAPARRPTFSVLDCSKAAACGVPMRPWQDALGEYVMGLR